jgi:iron-sulfur cluster repair protein YtfE (RIC family)
MDLNEFVNNLRKHFKEEEQIVFPLTLRAQAAN